MKMGFFVGRKIPIQRIPAEVYPEHFEFAPYKLRRRAGRTKVFYENLSPQHLRHLPTDP